MSTVKKKGKQKGRKKQRQPSKEDMSITEKTRTKN